MAYCARKALFGALFSGTLAACAVVDTVDPRFDTVNRSTARARNESILLNIVRASRNDPLNFVAFNRVGGTTQATANAAMPTFLVGPPPIPTTIQRDFTFNDRTLGGSMQAINTFDISILETGNFYTGLMTPVDLPTLNFFIRQGYSRELLFWLFTESVRITEGNRTREVRNDAFDISKCDPERLRNCFPTLIDIASVTGLTVEITTVMSAPKGQSKEATRTTIGRLCFDPILASQAQRDLEIGDVPLSGHVSRHPLCGKDPWPEASGRKGTAANTIQFGGSARRGAVDFEITTRSTFSMYRFLGRILATNQMNEIALRSSSSHPGEDPRILSITRDRSGCFVDVAYEGEYYCVPQEGADNTKRIFGLLAQLLALKTQVQDLGITPVVRVSP